MLMHVDQVHQLAIWAVCAIVVTMSVTGAIVVELIARFLLAPHVRQANNLVASAMFSVVGVTFAVLLAFVAMLTLEGYLGARSATSIEASAAWDVNSATLGLPDPIRSQLQAKLRAYLTQVIGVEWPAQAKGHVGDDARSVLGSLDALAAGYTPIDRKDADYLPLLVSSLGRLSDARASRQLASGSSVPAVVWAVVLLGGALTIVFSSFIGAPSARFHIAMSATLAASGAFVVAMVIVLSQPFRGQIGVSPAPLQQVLSSLEQEDPGATGRAATR